MRFKVIIIEDIIKWESVGKREEVDFKSEFWEILNLEIGLEMERMWSEICKSY